MQGHARRKGAAPIGPPGPANGYMGPHMETGAQATHRYPGGVTGQGCMTVNPPQNIQASSNSLISQNHKISKLAGTLAINQPAQLTEERWNKLNRSRTCPRSLLKRGPGPGLQDLDQRKEILSLFQFRPSRSERRN